MSFHDRLAKIAKDVLPITNGMCLTADGAEKNWAEIWRYTGSGRLTLPLKPYGLIQAGGWTSDGDMDQIGRSGAMSMKHDRRCATVKRDVRKIDVRQHDDQQHQENETDEYHQCRRFNLPLRHSFNLFCQRNGRLSIGNLCLTEV